MDLWDLEINTVPRHQGAFALFVIMLAHLFYRHNLRIDHCENMKQQNFFKRQNYNLLVY